MALSGFDLFDNTPSLPAEYLKNEYLQNIEDGDISLDTEQLRVIEELQIVFEAIIHESSQLPQKNSLSSFFSKFIDKKEQTESINGLYLYGGVGRGKTYLVDFFFDRLPIENKLRIHFHRFMQIVHEELAKHDGVKDPLKHVAKSFSDKARVLCFDEFHVIDITDAMLLGRLLEYLFEDGLVLVTTSNFHPDELYKNGLQRDRFVPAINLLKEHTKVVKMEGAYDYRSEAFKELGIYYFISDKFSNQRLEDHFQQLVGVELYEGWKHIIINGRKIPVHKFNTGLVWFDFNDLCNAPRSTEDFTQIASFFKTVLISNIPLMDSNMNDAARRFINMIDTFYDMHVNIIVSAAKYPDDLYSGNKLAFEFDRAISRIHEMQTSKYIESVHKAKARGEQSISTV